MAQLTEILKLENDRSTSEAWQMIYLHKDGKFYRAYQMSAWLYSCVINEYKVTHRRFKSVDESVLFVGFPIESLMKRMPEEVILDLSDEQLLRLKISEQQLTALCGDLSPQEAFEQWKEAHPFATEPSITNAPRKDSKPQEIHKVHSSMFGIMQQILSFPVESKSPIDCMLFLADVRRSIAEHF